MNLNWESVPGMQGQQRWMARLPYVAVLVLGTNRSPRFADLLLDRWRLTLTGGTIPSDVQDFLREELCKPGLYLGLIFDSDMSFADQINSVSKSCHFHIRGIYI